MRSTLVTRLNHNHAICVTIQHIIKKVVIIYDVKQVRNNSAGDGTNIIHILR